MEIFRAGKTPSREGPADWFTGRVRIDGLFNPAAPDRVQGAQVTFEPGARTAWHTHPLGQTLIVTSGLGRAQREAGSGACQHRAAGKRQGTVPHLGFPQFLQAANAASDEPSSRAAAAAKALHQPTASNIRPPPAAPIMMANWMTAT